MILYEMVEGENPFYSADYQKSLLKNFECILNFKNFKTSNKLT